MKPPLNAQPNQSLIDGIATLQALAMSPEPIGSRELARQLGIDSTKVNRLLKTLAYLGIARQTANRKYTAGPGMHVLAAQSLFASGLIRRALPVLEGLRRFGHTVALGVLWGDSVSYLFHAPPGIEASRGLGRIGLLPATTSGIGIVLLSEHDDDDEHPQHQQSDLRIAHEEAFLLLPLSPVSPLSPLSMSSACSPSRRSRASSSSTSSSGRGHSLVRMVTTQRNTWAMPPRMP